MSLEQFTFETLMRAEPTKMLPMTAPIGEGAKIGVRSVPKPTNPPAAASTGSDILLARRVFESTKEV